MSASMAERFAAVDLVVVGSAMVDQITYCERIPDDGETLHARRYVQGFGGKGANQAVMAARLGARVAFVGCVGDDAIGSATVENLARAGVDTSGVSVVAGTATGVAPIWVDDRGANRILIAAGANDALDAERVTAAVSARGRTPHLVLAQLETPAGRHRGGVRVGRGERHHDRAQPGAGGRRRPRRERPDRVDDPERVRVRVVVRHGRHP